MQEEEHTSITEGKLIVDVKIQTLLNSGDSLNNNVALYFETPHLMLKYHFVYVNENRNPPALELLHSELQQDCRQFVELPATNQYNTSCLTMH